MKARERKRVRERGERGSLLFAAHVYLKLKDLGILREGFRLGFGL